MAMLINIFQLGKGPKVLSSGRKSAFHKSCLPFTVHFKLTVPQLLTRYMYISGYIYHNNFEVK